jgi:predicted membrane-bound dolichyl-phosphate-mannose-protein mannosyltransferase
VNGRLRGRFKFAPIHALIVVLLVSVLCRSFRLRVPNQAIIFDEKYYVNAARVILGRHVAAGDPYAGQPVGLDPNHEHPPLGKLLIAGSMRLFGDDPLGWRLPSLLAGVASIVLVYAIVRAAGGDGWLAVVASTVFAFDNLVLVHSRIATLDMPFVAFLLLGVWCWLRGWHLAAGGACALAALIKLPALYGFAALLLLAVGRIVRERLGERAWRRSSLRAATLLVLGFTVVAFLGLWVLDRAFTPYDTPWAHVRYMLHYGFALSGHGGRKTVASPPWDWLANKIQIPYFRVVLHVKAHGQLVHSRRTVDFRGAMNPAVIYAAPLAFAYVAWRAWRVREALSLWVVAWVAATYLPYYALVLLTDRTTYIFYFLATLPAVAVAIAQLLRQSRLPQAVTWAYLVLVAVGFGTYFPFRRIF